MITIQVFQRFLMLLACWLLTQANLVLLPANAQDKWTFTGEHPLFENLYSTSLEAGYQSCHYGLGERTLITQHRDGQNNYQWICYELPSLKKISTVPEPPGWIWEMSAVGTKYACSFYAGHLNTIDLATGAMLKPVSVAIPSRPELLFDKAIWIESGLVLALPGMTVVPKHPLVNTTYDHFDNNKYQNATRLEQSSRSAWRLDANRWVVNGLVFGADLKPENLYLGNYAWRGQVRDATFLAPIAGVKSGSSAAKTDVTIQFQNKVVGEASCAITGLSAQTQFMPCGNGYMAVSGQTLMYLENSKGQSAQLPSGGIEQMPVLIPPYLKLGGEFQPAQWLNGRGRVECEFRSNVKLDTKVENDQLLLRVGYDETALKDPMVMKPLMQRVEALSKLGPQASWEEMIAAYKANNIRWLVPYATALKVRFSGIPIDMPCQLTYLQNELKLECMTSIVVDVPEEALKPFRTPDLPPAVVRPENDTTGQQYLQALTGEQAQTVNIESLPPPESPALAPIPGKMSPDLVKGEFNWIVPTHVVRLWQMRSRIFLNVVGMMLAVWLVRLTDRGVHFVGQRWSMAMLVALACVFFDTALLLLIDLLTEGLVGDSAFLLTLRGSVKFGLYIACSLFVYWIAIEAKTAQKLVVYGLASAICGLPVLALLMLS